MDCKRYLTTAMSAVVAGLFLVSACAKISSPSGGPRDEDPPVIVKSRPENGTVMFAEKSFTLAFNEFVVLDRISEKFMVSPPLSEKPEIKLRGKELIVSWDEMLVDSTTYTFYFQDAIRDNNENNPIPNFQYVLSTGPVLDSLSLTGNVFNAFDLEADPEMLVMMYSNLSDTAPRTLIPAYIAKPDVSGGFVISNIKPGSYRLFALKDMNNNKMYDLDDEGFAFMDSVLTVTPDEFSDPLVDTVNFKPQGAAETTKPSIFTFGNFRMFAFNIEPRKQYLKFAERKSAGSLTFGLAVPKDTSNFMVDIAGAGPEAGFLEHNSRCDSFRLWITDEQVYSQDVLEVYLDYPFTDSTGVIIQRKDTVTLRYLKPPAPRGGLRQTGVSYSTNLTGQIKPGTTGWFRGVAPMAVPDTSRISLVEIIDSLSVSHPVIFRKDSADSQRYFMDVGFQPGKSYSMTCLSGAFSDIYNNQSDSTVYRFKVTTSEDYGTVTARLTGHEGPVIVQMLAEKEKVVREHFIDSPGETKFELLDKGKYKMKVIYDLDSSRTWTTGNYELNREPEPVSYYPGEIDVKINWELEQDWDIGVKYSKDVSLRNKPEPKR